MKKDIYIIKNDINDKVYIGQATNTEYRWKRHLSDSKYEAKYQKNISVLHRAMAKYGADHFWYEILEAQIEDYNEKEKYYIKKYNSIVPNGYNITPGGNGLGYGTENVNALFNEEQIKEIISKISSSTKSLSKIAEEYGCNSEVICAINSGERYKQENLIYPLRETSRRYSKDKLKQVIYALKYEKDKTLKQISKEYEIDFSQLNEINWGRIYVLKNETYPLRKGKIVSLSDEQLKEIIKLLKDKSIPQKDIAKKFNVSKSVISGINKGNTYYQENISYPIRENYQRDREKSFIEPKILRRIEKDLINSNLSMRKISEKYNIPFPTILNINKGTTKKYRNNKLKYPIRK